MIFVNQINQAKSQVFFRSNYAWYKFVIFNIILDPCIHFSYSFFHTVHTANPFREPPPHLTSPLQFSTIKYSAAMNKAVQFGS